MPAPELKGILSLDQRPFREGLQSANRGAQDFGDRLKELFGREPVPERRAKRALESIGEGFVQTGTTAQNAAQAITGFTSALRLGFPVGAAVGTAAILIGAIATESEKSKTSLHELLHESDRLEKGLRFEVPEQGAEKLGERYKTLRQELRHLRDEERQYTAAHPIRAFLRGAGEEIRGLAGIVTGHPHTPQDVQIEEKLSELLKGQTQNRKDLVAAAVEELSVVKEQLTGNELLAKASEIAFQNAAKIAQLRKEGRTEEIGPTARISELQINAIKQQSDLLDNQFSLQMKLLGIRDQFLPAEQERLEILKAQTAAAREQVNIASSLGQSEQRTAALRLIGAEQAERQERIRAFTMTPAERIQERVESVGRQAVDRIIQQAERGGASGQAFGATTPGGEPIGPRRPFAEGLGFTRRRGPTALDAFLRSTGGAFRALPPIETPGGPSLYGAYGSAGRPDAVTLTKPESGAEKALTKADLDEVMAKYWN